MVKRPKYWVRLACVECDRDDCDGITPEQLGKLVADGKWGGVNRIQSWWESMDTTNCDDATDWYTHLGHCQACSGGDVECKPSTKERREKKARMLWE